MPLRCGFFLVKIFLVQIALMIKKGYAVIQK